jgi:hypothetical protein
LIPESALPKAKNSKGRPKGVIGNEPVIISEKEELRI